MLAIRMQRTGRKGSAQFRVVVQDSRRTPTSGNIVALLGHYDPHAKTTVINKEKISFYLNNGAQPSDRVIRILQHEKIDIPSWVKLPTNKTGSTKNKEKLRKNRPAEEVKEEVIVEAVDAAAVEAAIEDIIEEEEAEVIAEEIVTEKESAEIQEKAKVEETEAKKEVEKK